MKRIALPVLVFGLMMSLSFLPGCGDENTTREVLPGTAPQNPQEVTVNIPQGAANLGEKAFGENPLNIAAGTKVIWVNTDTVIHTVTAENNEFDSNIMQPGDRFEHTFADAGTFDYHCEVHPSMRGKVVVNGASPAPSPSGEPAESPTPSPTAEPSPEPSPGASPSPGPSPSLY